MRRGLDFQVMQAWSFLNLIRRAVLRKQNTTQKRTQCKAQIRCAERATNQGPSPSKSKLSHNQVTGNRLQVTGSISVLQPREAKGKTAAGQPFVGQPRFRHFTDFSVGVNDSVRAGNNACVRRWSHAEAE